MTNFSRRDHASERSSFANSSEKAAPAFSSPLFLCILILAIVVILHSFNFAKLSFQLPDAKALFCVSLFVGGLILAMIYGFFATLPALLAARGKPELAERCAEWWVSVTKKIASQSDDHIASLLQAAHICRLNANYAKSTGYCLDTLDSTANIYKLVEELPPATTDKQKLLKELSVNMARTTEIKALQAYLFMAWNNFDLGSYQKSAEFCEKVLREIDRITAGAKEDAKWKQPRANNILTQDLLVTSSDNRSNIALEDTASKLGANALELLGTMASLETDAPATKSFLRKARELRASQPNADFDLWTNNAASASLNLQDNKSALEQLEPVSARANLLEPLLRASILTNLGEAQRRLKIHKDAKDNLEKSLSIKKKLYKHGHPEIAESKFYLGLLENEQGNRQKAKQLVQESIEEPVMFMGSNHPILRARTKEAMRQGIL